MNLRNLNFDDYEFETLSLAPSDIHGELLIHYFYNDISSVRYVFFRFPENPKVVFHENYFIIILDYNGNFEKYVSDYLEDLREHFLKNPKELDHEDFRHFKEIFYI